MKKYIILDIDREIAIAHAQRRVKEGGFGFGFSGSRGGGEYPRRLALTGFWRDWTGSSPWTGTGSSGISGSNNLTEATNVPATFALNGHNAADFDGTNDKLTAGGTNDTYVNSLALSGWILFNSDASQARSLISGDTLGECFRVTIDATNAALRLNNNASASTRAVTHAAWQWVTFRYTGALNQVGINEAPGAAGGSSSVSYSTGLNNLTGALTAGITGGSTFFDGKIADFGITDLVLTDTEYGFLKTYINARYGLAL